MAWTNVTFRLRDFAGYQMGSTAEVYFHPVARIGTRSQSANQMVMVDRPIKVDMSEGEPQEVRLEDRNFYRLEVLWHDDDRTRVGRSETSHPFMVPVAGEDEDIYLANIIGLPPRNGMIRILDEDPDSSFFDQYIFNEETGDLFERSG